MKLLFNVDQKEALRRGIDAPNSTIQLDVEPSKLTQIQRDVLAAIMVNGHDCTQRCLDAVLDNADKPISGVESAMYSRPEYSNATSRLMLIEPSVAGLLVAIGKIIEQRDAYISKQKIERAKQMERAEEALAEEINKPTRGVWMSFANDRCDRIEVSNFSKSDSVFIDDYPHYPDLSWGYGDLLSEGSRKMYDARREEVIRVRDEIKERVREQLEQMRAERLAKKSEAEVKINQEYDELFARLPETFRERVNAGFALESEIETAMIDRMIKDAGYDENIATEIPFDTIEESDVLSDEQFLKLWEIKKSAPRYVDIEVIDAWNEDDDADDPDAGNAKYARLSWSKGGVTAVVFIPLD